MKIDQQSVQQSCILRFAYFCTHISYTFFNKRCNVLALTRSLVLNRTVKSSNFVRGSNFRHPKSDILEPPARFISQDMKFFQKHTLFEIFFSFDLILCQKGVNMAFFKDLYFVRFCDKINFEN